jgi:hypothetical protein
MPTQGKQLFVSRGTVTARKQASKAGELADGM